MGIRLIKKNNSILRLKLFPEENAPNLEGYAPTKSSARLNATPGSFAPAIVNLVSFVMALTQYTAWSLPNQRRGPLDGRLTVRIHSTLDSYAVAASG